MSLDCVVRVPAADGRLASPFEQLHFVHCNSQARFSEDADLVPTHKIIQACKCFVDLFYVIIAYHYLSC